MRARVRPRCPDRISLGEGQAEVLSPDICVIGAGSGGLSVAAAAAAFGVPVVLIAKATMGGDCLNYGSVPSQAAPPIPGGAETPYLTNETIFELKRCPEHLIIIGAGPIGLELAQAHRRLGAKVTVLEAAMPLAKDDPECAAIVLEQLAHEG